MSANNAHFPVLHVYKINAFNVRTLLFYTKQAVSSIVPLKFHFSKMDTAQIVWALAFVLFVDRVKMVIKFVINVYILMCYLKGLA